jgi:hypothetical protein
MFHFPVISPVMNVMGVKGFCACCDTECDTDNALSDMPSGLGHRVALVDGTAMLAEWGMDPLRELFLQGPLRGISCRTLIAAVCRPVCGC